MKYFLFYSPKPLTSATLRHVFDEAYQEKYSLELVNYQSGYFYADDGFLETIELLLPMISNDLGINLTFLVSHLPDSPLIKEAFKRISRFGQGVYHLADVVLDAIQKHDQAFLIRVKQAFDNVPHELMLTAKMLILCGLNRSFAARKLYVHRNTFNYRLNKFIELTNLDICDYFNAQFFYLFTQIER